MSAARRELKPLAVLAAMIAVAGALLCLISGMSNDRRLLGMGTLCLLVSALAFLAWALTATSELRRRSRELTGERPDLGDDEFAARFLPEFAGRIEVLAAVRSVLARRFKDLGGARFWPGDRLAEDLHLDELAPSDLADLPGALCRALEVSYDRWPEEAEAGWRTVRDVYLSALEATGERPGSPDSAPVQRPGRPWA